MLTLLALSLLTQTQPAVRRSTPLSDDPGMVVRQIGTVPVNCTNCGVVVASDGGFLGVVSVDGGFLTADQGKGADGGVNWGVWVAGGTLTTTASIAFDGGSIGYMQMPDGGALQVYVVNPSAGWVPDGGFIGSVNVANVVTVDLRDAGVYVTNWPAGFSVTQNGGQDGGAWNVSVNNWQYWTPDGGALGSVSVTGPVGVNILDSGVLPVSQSGNWVVTADLRDAGVNVLNFPAIQAVNIIDAGVLNANVSGSVGITGLVGVNIVDGGVVVLNTPTVVQGAGRDGGYDWGVWVTNPTATWFPDGGSIGSVNVANTVNVNILDSGVLPVSGNWWTGPDGGSLGYVQAEAVTLSTLAGTPSAVAHDGGVFTFDDNGALYIRGPVTTNQSLFSDTFSGPLNVTGTGTATFTNGSRVVTGSGTTFTTLNAGGVQYIKLAADLVDQYTPVERIVSNTQVLLTTPYQGTSGSGAFQVTNWGQIIAPGGSATVPDGGSYVSMVTGLNAGDVTIIAREVGFERTTSVARFALSSRQADQGVALGFLDVLGVSPPNQLAVFNFNGTDPTVVTCATSLYLTPQKTTNVTIPNGGTTATEHTYEVQVNSDATVFYIDDVLVARHEYEIPGPYTNLLYGVLMYNTGPLVASSTATLSWAHLESQNNFVATVYSTEAERLQTKATQGPGQDGGAWNVSVNNFPASSSWFPDGGSIGSVSINGPVGVNILDSGVLSVAGDWWTGPDGGNLGYLRMPDGGPVEVYTTNSGSTTVVIPDGGLPVNVQGGVVSLVGTDVFGAAVMSTRYNQIEVDYSSTDPDAISTITVTKTNGGDAINSGGQAVYSTGTNATGGIKAVTNSTTIYRPHAETYAAFTAVFTTGVANSYQRVGTFDTNNGFYVGYEGTDFGLTLRKAGVNTFTPRASWTDPLTGGAGSKYTRNGVPETMDPTKDQLWRIRYGWLGAAPVTYEILSPDGAWVTFYTYKHPNTNAATSINNPDLPITLDVQKTAGATNLIVSTACWAGGSTSDLVPIGSTINDGTLASMARAVITGRSSAGGGTYVNVKVNPSGALNVAATQDTLPWLVAGADGGALQVNGTWFPDGGSLGSVAQGPGQDGGAWNVSVNNFPATWFPDGGALGSVSVTGLVGVNIIDAGTVPVSQVGTWSVGVTQWSSGLTVDLRDAGVNVLNFPATQTVAGTVTSNQGTSRDGGTSWPVEVTNGLSVVILDAGTLAVSGTVEQGAGQDGGAWNVSVNNWAQTWFPDGGALGSVSITGPVGVNLLDAGVVVLNFPATQPVSGTVAATQSGTWAVNQGTGLDGGTGWGVWVENQVTTWAPDGGSIGLVSQGPGQDGGAWNVAAALTDGTNTVGIMPPSTTPTGAEPALVVSMSPNSLTNIGSLPLPPGAATEATLLTLATETTLAQLPLVQGSATAGQSGPLAQSASTKFGPGQGGGPPSYIDGTTNPLSTSLSGGLRVELQSGASGVPLASSQSTPSGSEEALIVRNIPSGTQTISGTVSGSGTFDQNLAQYGGVAVGAGNGVYVRPGTGASFTVAQPTAANLNATVTGTVAATQSGTWSTRTQDGTGNAVESAVSSVNGANRGLVVRPVLKTATNMLASSVSCATTATALPATALTGRESLCVQNNGTGVIYLGGSTVTTATGFPLARGATYCDDLGSQVLFCIVGAGTENARVLEQ